MNRFNHPLYFVLAFAFTLILHAGEPNLKDLKAKLASPAYETRVSAIKALLAVGQKRQLKKEEIELLLPHFKSDPDWRIKTRIASVLPSAENPDWVLVPLLKALQDRQAESNGNGNVPGYACKNLARLGDPRALEPMREWLSFLKSHPDTYPDIQEEWIKQAERWISELEAKLKKNGNSNKNDEPDGSP